MRKLELKVELYVCEVCGERYSDKEDCIRCEKQHKQELTIQEARYLPFSKDESGMPATITVTNGEDGKPYIYKR